jgi:hypothetical protein
MQNTPQTSLLRALVILAFTDAFFLLLWCTEMNRMKKLILIAVVTLVSSCNREKGLSWFSAGKADEYFRLTEEICNKDNGKLWGENLCGPIIYIDNGNREIYANVADRENNLKARDGIFTGVLPKERIITNNVIDFGGTKYAMVPLPGEEDSYRILSRTFRSLFHCFQERNGLRPSAFSARHLNDRNARLYLKLEWKALTYAIKTSGETRNQAVRDALVFRGARRELFPEAIEDENKFESYEGLTTFTYIKLCTSGPEEMKQRILEYLDRIYQNRSYAWGYGFVHGALYATLLDEKGFDFKQIKQPDYDLGKATLDTYGITMPAVCRDVAGSLAMSYDIQAIRLEESERLEQINEHMRHIVNTFLEKPVVVINMESPNFSFEPEDINFLDTLGTLYNRLRVSDNWGRLAVDDGGALITNDLSTLRISARNVMTERNHISGDGWNLVLNDGWQAAGDGKGGYTVSKKKDY